MQRELIFVSHSKQIMAAQYTFTPAGMELARLCIPLEPHYEFREYLARFWQRQGARVAYSLEEVLPM